jgi:NADH-quinone oxidoreductase subunit A
VSTVNILLTPPIAFIIILLVAAILSRITVIFAAKGKDSAGKNKAYACGETPLTNRAQPDYAQFFPFAFFFTIMHVAVLIVTTMPQTTAGLQIAVIYLIVALLSLFILFRKQDA